ncbi:hypothetical protein KAFR_0H00320 [Kazachstania africana CBS 2517]|uniref:Uncharacterized protein n=1 Tax=Kazachstania africana (strain ATCC 22294 / BCRC 22015 / CBS 2517 / CECT 1963 / NBRC 1671 / NRRL Y-8276) TaxID=1071382 RepID=H2AYN5_KAZAF|nr:hypothetical protein KAFR_0H00320 [Kazachstania africana CBS 2517]CCF59441.1 hypothetical protein KAFR_0H00320 [Kazachstania africana CBS 2517]
MMLNFVRRFHVSTASSKELESLANGVTNELPKLQKHKSTIYNYKKSASNYQGYLKGQKKLPVGLYFDPSQSSPTGSINSETIPLLFLPKDDIRRRYIDQIRAHSKDKVQSQVAPAVLCSKSTMRGHKTYHLKPEQVQEIIKLRKENPTIYTRKTLAKKYDVSPLFISIVSSVSPERSKEMDRRLQTIKSRWHEQRAVAREDRKKRKQMWYIG